jgi:hypothetical protein
MPLQKIYKKESSPLFGLSNKRKLADLLKVDHLQLSKLSSDDFYSIKSIISNNKIRETQTPIKELRIAHINLFKLIRKIETPNYLFSGKKGLSYVDNACFHKDNNFIVAMDIEKFYQNSKREYVFRFLRYSMKMSEDISYLLSKIICYKDFIPTGSSLSQCIAYWSYNEVFDDIFKSACDMGIKFSLYVDDMTFSSPLEIKKDFHLLVNSKLKKVALHIKKSKLKYYSKKDYKLITGCIITPNNEIKVPNYIRKNILVKLDKLSNLSYLPEKDYNSLLGSIVSAQQIEKDIFEKTRGYLRHSKEKILMYPTC